MSTSSQLPPFADTKTKFTETRNPGFTFGQKVNATDDGQRWVEGEKAGWKVIDTSKESPMDLYKMMISGIVPRPIAFVSSIAEDGTENLAPFSWFNMVTHNPPLVSISVATSAKGMKDTAHNIKATKNFTVNIISEPFIENANVSSIDTPSDISEWPLTGLTKEPSIHVKAARVKESAFSMECELYQAVDITHPDTGAHTTSLILGLVKYIHVRTDVLNERGLVDLAALRPVGRGGDITYTRVGDAFRLLRPAWSDEAERARAVIQGDVSGAGGKL